LKELENNIREKLNKSTLYLQL